MASSRNKTIRYEDLDAAKLYSKVQTQFTTLEESLNTTFHRDAVELLSEIPTSSIDLIVTDPPYNKDKYYAGEKFSASDNMSYEAWLETWMKNCKRILKETGSIYICCDWQSSIPVYNVLSRYFDIKNRITWEREKGR